MNQPHICILAGPNGVGKTTYARRFLPAEVQCLEFINADMIAQGLSPFAPDRATITAGRIMLARLNELIAARESFAFETTLSGRGYSGLLRAARTAGYRILLDFLWVPSLPVTRSRVAQRVRKGGHDIPGPVQERRFTQGIRNRFALYRPLLDHWRIFDNSGAEPLCIAEEVGGRMIIHVPALFDKLPFTRQLRHRHARRSFICTSGSQQLSPGNAAGAQCHEPRLRRRCFRKPPPRPAGHSVSERRNGGDALGDTASPRTEVPRNQRRAASGTGGLLIYKQAAHTPEQVTITSRSIALVLAM